jgi:hypothetical protein
LRSFARLGLRYFLTRDQSNLIDAERFVKAFERLFAEVLLFEGEAIGKSFVNGLRDTYPTGYCELFDALRKYNARACDGPVCEYSLPKCDTDSYHRDNAIV